MTNRIRETVLLNLHTAQKPPLPPFEQKKCLSITAKSVKSHFAKLSHGQRITSLLRCGWSWIFLLGVSRHQGDASSSMRHTDAARRTPVATASRLAFGSGDMHLLGGRISLVRHLDQQPFHFVAFSNAAIMRLTRDFTWRTVAAGRFIRRATFAQLSPVASNSRYIRRDCSDIAVFVSTCSTAAR